jgi:two-component system, sensor histidine kinase PdtaS
MCIHNGPHAVPPRKALMPETKFQRPANCPLAKCSAISMYEQELKKHNATEAKLRRSLIRESALLREKDDLIQQKDILSKESEHRMLNGLQSIISLLSMQSRETKNAEAAAQLTVAANRVATIARVHQHLHALDQVKSVELKRYLESLCHDLAGMVSNESPERVLVIEGAELRIPTTTGIPLGFIVSELITNSTKYGKGRISVRLQTNSGKGYALSVSDEGPGLPEGFDPTATTGLGMKIVSSLVRQIGGQLQIAPGDNGKRTRFTVLFSSRGSQSTTQDCRSETDPGQGII